MKIPVSVKYLLDLQDVDGQTITRVTSNSSSILLRKNVAIAVHRTL